MQYSLSNIYLNNDLFKTLIILICWKIYKNTKSEAIKQLYFYPSSIFIDKKPRGFEEYIESVLKAMWEEDKNGLCK